MPTSIQIVHGYNVISSLEHVRDGSGGTQTTGEHQAMLPILQGCDALLQHITSGVAASTVLIPLKCIALTVFTVQDISVGDHNWII
jgi:hypothetical protein